jgi:hypothetical protein
MVDDWWIGKDWEESGRGLIEVTSRKFLGVTDKTTKTINEDSRYVGRDSKREPPE